MSPSRACKRSAHAMSFGSDLKSFRKITLASSAPFHAKEPVAGLQNVLNVTYSGESIKLLLQLELPCRETLSNFPLPFSIASYTAWQKTNGMISWFRSTWIEAWNHFPWHVATHSLSSTLCKISILVFLDRSRCDSTFKNTLAKQSTSSTALWSQLAMNCTKHFFYLSSC